MISSIQLHLETARRMNASSQAVAREIGEAFDELQALRDSARPLVTALAAAGRENGSGSKEKTDRIAELEERLQALLA